MPFEEKPADFLIRSCEPADIPMVARLFLDTYYSTDMPVPPSLVHYFQDLFLDHPYYDAETGSRVCIQQGQLVGFFGTLPARLTLDGRDIRATVAHSILVHRPRENPLVAAKLVRHILTGPQEITYGEMSNSIAVALWKPQGGQVVPGYGTEWMRVLRPSAFGAFFLGRTAAFALRPATTLFDKLIIAAAKKYLKVETSPRSYAGDEDVDESEFIKLVLEMRRLYKLRPVDDANLLAWQMRHAADKNVYGECHRRIVYDRGRRPIGGYIYYGRRGGCAFAMQILAKPGAAGPVVDSLFAHAYKSGNAVIRGKIDPRTSQALLERKCVFHLRTSTQVRTKNADLLAAIKSGDASLMGFSGQSWTRYVGYHWTAESKFLPFASSQDTGATQYDVAGLHSRLLNAESSDSGKFSPAHSS